MSLSALRSTSRLIDKLAKNGFEYNGINLSMLLQNLDIHESDILYPLSRCEYNVLDIIGKVGIVRALTICDELCAPGVVSDILLLNLRLNRVMDNHIINSQHVYGLKRLICAYNSGYKIIPNYDIDSHTYCKPINEMIVYTSMINNACNNGLFIRSILAHICCNDILPHILHDMIYVHNHCKILLTCTNVESVCITDGSDLRNSPFVKNIKNLRSWSVTDDMLKSCINLRRLYAYHNYAITTCAPFSNTLRILHVNESAIGDCGLEMCKKIKKLDATHNKYITTCEPFAHSLIILHATYSSITDAGLVSCTRIKELHAVGNEKITTCEPFAHTLTYLSATGELCGITDSGLAHCYKLKKLYADDNSKITTCEPFAHTLTYLSASGESCGISDSGLAHCYKLKTLYAYSNNKINTIAHFSLLTRFTYTYTPSNLTIENEIKTFKNLRCN